MVSPVYHQPIEQLIAEYEQDSSTIKGERLVIANYPKVLLLSAASLFETIIKNSLTQFCNAPGIALPADIARINRNLRKYDVLSDKLFARFVANPRTNTTCASGFYALFTGTHFKTGAENNFTIIHAQKISDIGALVDDLYPMLGKGDVFDFEYAKRDDLLDIVNACTFDLSESAFLELKLRRNKVAHDYISGLTDTFADIRNFYYSAALYVMALDATLKSITA